MNNIKFCKKQCTAFLLKLKHNKLLSLKNVWLPHIFFLDTNGTYKDLLSSDSFKPHRNITVFERITDRRTRVSRDVQKICAITAASLQDLLGATPCPKGRK